MNFFTFPLLGVTAIDPCGYQFAGLDHYVHAFSLGGDFAFVFPHSAIYHSIRVTPVIGGLSTDPPGRIYVV